jgi:hypothetical protein
MFSLKEKHALSPWKGLVRRTIISAIAGSLTEKTWNNV